MKTLPQKVKAVQRVYEKLDQDIALLQKNTGLHCLKGCGECCKKPQIEATPIEFLPLALFWLDEGTIHSHLEELTKKKDDPLCYVFRPHLTAFGGLCNAYLHRGLICRLFGFTARVNKNEEKELVTCKFIKEDQAEAVISAHHNFLQDLPVMRNYYSRMANIDDRLNSFMPMRHAMIQAVEYTLGYYAYRKRRKVNKK